MGDMGRHGSTALVLGRSANDPDSPAAEDRPISSAGTMHLMTVAPQQSGQDRSCLIPNLLTYPGPMVVLDVDGVTHAATAEARQAMGQTVVRLDPFGVTGPETDALEPLDLLNGQEEPAITSRCLDIAGLLPLRRDGLDAADDEAFSLISALIGYVYAAPGKGTFNALYDTLFDPDFTHSMAVALDTVGKHLSKVSYAELALHLGRDEFLRTRTLAVVRSCFEALGTPEVRRTLSTSTLAISRAHREEPTTVYLVLPADRVTSHAALLRLWLGTLLLGREDHQVRAGHPAVFLLDRCADLGPFPLLESLLAMRSEGPEGSEAGVRIWTFWHDVNQLRATCPDRWREIVSGCDAVQFFATKDAGAAAGADALLGLSPGSIWSLGPADQMLVLDGTPRRTRRPAL